MRVLCNISKNVHAYCSLIRVSCCGSNSHPRILPAAIRIKCRVTRLVCIFNAYILTKWCALGVCGVWQKTQQQNLWELIRASSMNTRDFISKVRFTTLPRKLLQGSFSWFPRARCGLFAQVWWGALRWRAQALSCMLIAFCRITFT